MYILKRVLAILLGVTVLPLRVLIYNIWYALVALLLGIGLTVGLPIVLASFLHSMGMPKVLNALLNTFIVFPLIMALSTIALASTAAYLIYNTVVGMFKAVWLGLKNGFLHGMEGFWHTLATQSVLGDTFSSYLSAFSAGVGVDELINDTDFDGFQRVAGDLEDVIVIHKDLDVPDLQSKGPKEATALLTDSESQQIDDVVKQIETSKEPLPQHIKEKLSALRTLFTQYKDLSNKLEMVRAALISNDKSKINDELIAFNDVETPILLVKQYKNEGQWYNVPASSYITDKESLLHWLKTNPKHPINKDLLKNPLPYNQMETKYTWYELTVKDCSSDELVEAAAQMRILSSELRTQLSAAQRIDADRGSRSSFFFSSLPDRNSDTSSFQQDDPSSAIQFS
jgi:hypothetical protein